jgi:FkbM family methyltransferase
MQEFSRFVHDVYLRHAPVAQIFDGSRLAVDPFAFLGRCLLSEGVVDPPQTRFMCSVLKKGMNVVDVGANVGYFTCIMANLIAPTGEVHAFEPDRTNFRLLRRNLQINRLRNVFCEQVACCDRNGRGILYLSNRETGGHTTNVKSGKTWRTRSVPMIALDDFFREKNERIDLVKIDTAGSEDSVLRGMRGLVKSNPGIKILVETRWNKKDVLSEIELQSLRTYSLGSSGLPSFLSYREIDRTSTVRVPISLVLTTQRL